MSHWQGYCFYDDTKTAISGSGQFISSIPSADSTDPITIPDGARYIAVAFDIKGHQQDKTAFMANWGISPLVYVPYGAMVLPDESVSDAQINGKLSLDKVDTAKLLLPTVGKNLMDKSQMVKDKAVDNTGAIVDKAASLQRYYVGDIRVTGGADYLVYAKNVVFFDTYGNVCGSDGNADTFAYRKIKAPISAVSCAVNSSQYADCPAHMIHSAFMVEGSVLPTRVVCEKITEKKPLSLISSVNLYCIEWQIVGIRLQKQ